MSSRPSRAEHEAALARRLQLLSAELHGVRDGPWAVPDTHTRVRVGARHPQASEPAAVVPGAGTPRRPAGPAAWPRWCPRRCAAGSASGPARSRSSRCWSPLGLAVTAGGWSAPTPRPWRPVAPRPAADLAAPSRPQAAVSPAAAGDGHRRRRRQGTPARHRRPRRGCPGGRRAAGGRRRPAGRRPDRPQPGPAARRRRADRGRASRRRRSAAERGGRRRRPPRPARPGQPQHRRPRPSSRRCPRSAR